MPDALPSVVLIGPMAAGKSRIGRRVAKLLGEPFIDTDVIVASEHGPIPGIFERLGETGFRAFERQAVADALRAPGVVSLGGGAVLDAETRSDLTELPVVLLMTSAEAAEARLKSGSRPLLGDGGIDRWIEILEARRPIYESLARTTIDTSKRPAELLAQEIADWARRSSTTPSAGSTT